MTLYNVGEILRSHCRTIPPNVSKIVIFVCILIKYCMYFDKIYVRYCKMCVVCSKVNFITNITNSTRIHTFYFYNNKHTFINTNTTFITKHTNFIKINTGPVTGPKCSPQCRWEREIKWELMLEYYYPLLYFFLYSLQKSHFLLYKLTFTKHLKSHSVLLIKIF